jgi:hypothetical protein
MLNTPVVARIDGSKHAHRRNRLRSQKRSLKNASKPKGVSGSRTSSTRLVTRRRGDAAPVTRATLGLEDEFFSQTSAVPAEPVQLEEQPAVPTMTTGQLARRLWFRRQVTHLMAGLTAFTGVAALVHIATIG